MAKNRENHPPMTAPHLGPSAPKPTANRPDGKRGAPFGNQRAVKHGYYTAAAREARWQAWQDLLAACKSR
jgi:hypothetical protein